MIQKLLKQDFFHANGCPVVVDRRDPQGPCGLHSHEFLELVIITGGRGVHVTDEDSYELSAGAAFVIAVDRPHDYLDLEDLRLINVLVDAPSLSMPMTELKSLPGFHALFTLEPAWRKRHGFGSRLQLSPPELVEAIRMIEALEGELTERRPGYGVMATTTLLQLITFLSRCYGEPRSPQSQSLLCVAEAITHLETHFANPVTLDELVAISKMSRRNFIRTFEATMGLPPIQYLIQLRVQQACKRLLSDNRSITEIAMAVGFNDSNYFSRQFRQVTGVSPRDYRQRGVLP